MSYRLHFSYFNCYFTCLIKNENEQIRGKAVFLVAQLLKQSPNSLLHLSSPIFNAFLQRSRDVSMKIRSLVLSSFPAIILTCYEASDINHFGELLKQLISLYHMIV